MRFEARYIGVMLYQLLYEAIYWEQGQCETATCYRC